MTPTKTYCERMASGYTATNGKQQQAEALGRVAVAHTVVNAGLYAYRRFGNRHCYLQECVHTVLLVDVGHLPGDVLRPSGLGPSGQLSRQAHGAGYW